MNQFNQIRIAAVVMFIGICLGAIGAHAFKPTLQENGYVEEWKTAAMYQLIHGLAIFVVALVGRKNKLPWCSVFWLVGILLFSGSLYVLSYTGNTAKPIVLATPLGGLSFLIGWLFLVIMPQRALS